MMPSVVVVKRFKGGLVSKAHRLLRKLTPGSKVVKNRREVVVAPKCASRLVLNTRADPRHGSPNPKLYTLNPTPQTANPRPSTLNSLNPQFSDRNDP